MTRAVITILASVLASSTAVRAQDGTFVLVDTTRVSSVHASTDRADAYAVTFEGRLLRSADEGLTWQLVYVDSTTVIRDIAICSGYRRYASTLDGVRVSDDRGLTWGRFGETRGRYPDLVCLPNHDVLLGTTGRLVVLRKDATTFDTFFEGSVDVGATFSLAEVNSATIAAGYVGCLESNCGGVAISTDGGATFSLDPSWNIGVAVLGIATTSTGSLFAAGLARDETDLNWTWPDGYLKWDDVRTVVPTGGDSLLAINNGLYVSPNGGRSWSQVSGAPGGARDIAVTKTGVTLLAAGGIWRAEGALPVSTSWPEPVTTTGPALSVYPNPFVDELNVELSGFTCRPELSVMDLTGRLLGRLGGVDGGGTMTLRLGSQVSSSRLLVSACCDDRCAAEVVVRVE